MTPNTDSSPQAPGAPKAWRFLDRRTLLAFAAGIVVTVGAGLSAGALAMGGWHHGSIMDGTHSAAEVNAHVDHVLKHFYVEVDATETQKAQIGPLVKQAVSDLLPLHAQIRAARAQAEMALTQTTVDRASLEAVRQQHLQLAEQASKRLSQLIGDVGDALTPAQRQALIAHLDSMHAMPSPTP
jgi:Spy/CpxP family protein refolding chaperone